MITNPNKLLEDMGYRLVPTDRKRILKQIDKYPYIEFNYIWYDDDEYPDEYTWFDIEGMGYGWLFLHHKPKEYREVIAKHAKKLITRSKLYQKMGIIKDENNLIFSIPSKDMNRIYSIRLSNDKDSKYFFM